MKVLTALVLLGLTVAGGCSTKTLSAEDFLYTYRCGALPGEMGGNSAATYAGRDEQYHFIEVAGSTPSQWFMGPAGKQKYRCWAYQLPPDFPNGFETLQGGESFEAGTDTHDYVSAYLRKNKGRSEAPEQTKRQPDSKTPIVMPHDDE